MATAQEVISFANGEVGYDRFLDPATGTKYGRFYAGLTGNPYYGENGVPYCAMFVSYVFNKCGVSAPGFPSAYCPDIHKKQNVAPKDLQPGDAVLFDWENDGTDDHVGIFVCWEDANKQYANTIEGNTNKGKVLNRTRSVSTICGGVRPNWDNQTIEPNETIAVDNTSELMELSIGAGMNNPIKAVKALQGLLRTYGYQVYYVDGEFGELTEKALKEYQSRNGLEPDGVCGRLTWASLLGVQ